MTPEERQLLIQTHRMTEENNKLLRKMHRSAIWGNIFRFLYWGVIIALSVGAYYFIQPYIEQVPGLYGGIKEDVGSVRAAVDQVDKASSQIGNIGNLLKNIGH